MTLTYVFLSGGIISDYLHVGHKTKSFVGRVQIILKMEKILSTSNIFFYHNVVKSRPFWLSEIQVYQMKILILHNRILTFSYNEKAFEIINHFPNKPWFLCVCCTSLLKKQWEGEIAWNKQCFCFLPVLRTFCHFHQILNCLQTLSVWRNLKICRLGKS